MLQISELWNIWTKNWQFEGRVDSSTTIVGNFNTLLSKRIEQLDRNSKRNRGHDQYHGPIAPTDIYRKIPENPFFSNVQGTSSKMEHLLGHKLSPNKVKRLKSWRLPFLIKHNETRNQ